MVKSLIDVIKQTMNTMNINDYMLQSNLQQCLVVLLFRGWHHLRLFSDVLDPDRSLCNSRGGNRETNRDIIKVAAISNKQK